MLRLGPLFFRTAGSPTDRCRRRATCTTPFCELQRSHNGRPYGIVGTWSAIKAQFRSQGTKKVKGEFDSYLGEYMWRRLCGGATLKGLFPCFLRGITFLYKPQTRDSPK
ncbi:hypothetical protein AVEN_245104-1 [Araneus ventricosus]|uniref:Uncharacterized protein n=1 Tax=Araneus ventricosus TaxID=182803 RepID=A0A4Y2TDU1_ARAVE|nr:hypothetical protein AVEN_245104-1 [Araneus ventricosus]